MNYAQEFIQALDEEIEAIKAGKGGSTVKVFNGRFIREMSGLFVYAFNLENFLAVLEESPAEIEIHGNIYPVQVLLTQGLEVEIGLEHFLGKFIPEAKLQTKLWYLLELLKKKYVEYLNGEAKIDFSISEATFSGKKTNFKSTTQEEVKYSVSKDEPNESQRLAIEASFSSQLAIIWGPPGTGKTQTIAWAIEAHLNAGRRVLLVSHANNAVDEALEKVAEQLKPTPFYTEGKLIRFGTPPQAEHFEKMKKDYELVLLDKIAERLGESLTKEKAVLEGERLKLEDILVQLRKTCESLQSVRTVSSELNALKSSISEFSGKLDIVHDELTSLEQEQERSRNKLIEYQSSGKIKRVFLGLNPQKIQRMIDQSNMLMDSKKRLLSEIIHRLQDLANTKDIKEKEVAIAQTKSNTLLMELGISIPELESKMKRVEKQKESILARITEINRQLEEIQRKILSEAKLVATTLTKTCIAKQFPDTPFDVLILDEASMAPLPYIYWAASKCRTFVTIVGDFLQLPPICIADKPMARKWLGRSIFTVLGIDKVEDVLRDTRVKMLNIQYRMVPAISAIPERLFYKDRLIDSDKVKNVTSMHDSISENPLVLIETAEANPWCSMISIGGRFNLYNALVSATLAKHIISKIDSIRTSENPNAKIGILTPYRAQARLINKIAKDWKLSDFVRISTVHTFQGGEEPIVIFDSCEGSGTKVAPMLDDTKPDSDAHLVLNVAITRAKRRLYFVGNTKHLLSDLHPNSALSKIINHFQKNAEIINSETLVDNYFTTDFDKWADALLSTDDFTREPVSGDLYTEKNFWARFFQDLKIVKELLIILSPFVTIRRSTVLMDYFRSLRHRGVEIRIYTRPKNQQIGDLANQANIVIEQLQSIGAKVIERRGMHQKVAILDNTIAWEGSLNILSHRDSGEHMRRFESSSAIEEIIRSLELGEEIGVGNQTEEKCPGSKRLQKCDGYLVVRRSKDGRRFFGCSNFPRCNYTKPIVGYRKKKR
jgi:KaiC/GvpD/RAD55 family RecA-like ATPase